MGSEIEFINLANQAGIQFEPGRRRPWLTNKGHLAESFRTLRLCHRERGRIHRRLRQLLADIASADAYVTDHGRASSSNPTSSTAPTCD